MNLNELATAVSYRLPIVVCVLDNRGLGMYLFTVNAIKFLNRLTNLHNILKNTCMFAAGVICLGAAMTTLTSQFLYLNMHYYTDMARLGAQVVAGIGFIGAGAIIVTRRRRVKGLTTAAGLWAAAIVGLCLGGGFYEGGICATALILAAEMFLSKLEYRMLDNAPEVNLYMEYSNKTCLDNVLKLFRELNLKVLNMEITRSTETEIHNACALFTLRLNKRCRVEQLIPKMNATEGVVSVEEL